jgi:hypothetical protein
VLAFLTDQSFLSAMAAAIGPLAFFAAPTEEIERLLFDGHTQEMVVEGVLEVPANEGIGIPEAA